VAFGQPLDPSDWRATAKETKKGEIERGREKKRKDRIVAVLHEKVAQLGSGKKRT
jgi:hypothetical protein